MKFHKHDCSKCNYLGSEVFGSDNFDYYSCEDKIDGITLIARFGEDGSYSSFPKTFIDATRQNFPLARAKIFYLAAA